VRHDRRRDLEWAEFGRWRWAQRRSRVMEANEPAFTWRPWNDRRSQTGGPRARRIPGRDPYHRPVGHGPLGRRRLVGDFLTSLDRRS